MANIVSLVSSIKPVLEFVCTSLTPSLSIHACGTQKIIALALANFTLLQNMSLSGFGLRELGFDSLRSMKGDAREYFTIHGALFIASGAFGIIGVVYKHAISVILGQGFFLVANLIALEYNGELYRKTDNPAVKKSALLGILNNLGYIFTVALAWIGVHGAITLLVGCLAVSTGCLKMLYDFLYEI